MKINEDFVLQSIGQPALIDIARQSSGVADLELEQWRVTRIAGGLGNPVSAGLYRVGGDGRSGGEPVRWSTILKVIQSPANAGWTNMGEGDDPTHWNYWKRELLVYRSALLDTLPEGLVAPRCFATHELPGEMAWLWLEDVTEACGGEWPLERYALAARHLGRLNGLYGSKRPLPDYPWLGRRRLRQWKDLFTESAAIPWEHPLVRSRYPEAEIANLQRMVLEIEDFMARLDRLPQTLCHGDTYPTNFKSRGTGGGEQTVALDWALANVGPLGCDLGSLVLGAYLNLPRSDLARIDRDLFGEYMAGLRDSDCRVESAAVRFGYTTYAALSITLFTLGMMGIQIRDTQPAGEVVEPPNPRPCFEAVMADFAWELRDFV